MRTFRGCYRTLRALGVGRIASMRAAWRVTFGPEPDEGEWPEPHHATGAAQEAAQWSQARPWWRRLLGG